MVQCANIDQYCKYSPQDRLPLLWHVRTSCKDNSINAYSPNPEFSLYLTMSPLTQPPQSTIASFQTMRPHMLQHVNPKLINPLLEHMPLEEVLGLWALYQQGLGCTI